VTDKRTECIKVWLSPEDELVLRRFALEDDRKLSDYVRVVLRKHIEMMQPEKARVYPLSPVPIAPFRDDGEERMA
jgi:hypothetical protein